MKKIISAIALSLICGIASASSVIDVLNEAGASYVFDSTSGFLTLFENNVKTNVDISTLCASSEVNKITVYNTIAAYDTSSAVTNCTQ